jgi:hypothetical protein
LEDDGMPRKTVVSQRQPLQASPAPGSGPTHADYAKVHIAKRDLKLTDQLYRGVLNVLFGETSAKELSHEQIDELLDHFKSLGWESNYPQKSTSSTNSRSKPQPISAGRKSATMAQLGLIMYLWKHGPGIRNKSTQALDYFLNHHFHIPELKQVKARQVSGVLGAIRKMAHL